MPKGSLPRYAINLEELVEFLIPKWNGEIKFNKERQRSKGVHISTSNKGTYTETWIPKFDIAITGLQIASGGEVPSYMDNFTITIEKGHDSQEIFSSVYMKDIYDYKNMKCFFPVKADSKIIITYNNDSQTEKDVWFDIDYTCEEHTSHVVIFCIDEDTGQQIHYESLDALSLGEHTILAPKIDKYQPKPTYFQKVVIDTKAIEDKFKAVTFVYRSLV